MRKWIVISVLSLVWLVLSGLAWAGLTSQQIYYTKATTGLTVPGTYTFKFSLWSASSGGSEIWWEKKDVSMTTKTLTTYLGSVTDISRRSGLLGDLDFSQQYWVQVEKLELDGTTWTAVGTRTKFNMVPYAMWSAQGGDVNSVTAGDGLTSTDTTGDITLNVGAGAGISVGADGVSVKTAGVTAAMLAASAVTAAKLAVNAVTNAKIAAGAVTDDKITGPISVSKISSTGLNADTVDTKHAADFAASIHDHDAAYVNEGQANSITSGMILANAVTSGKIADGTITNADISGSAAIADTKLATISTAGKVTDTALSSNVVLSDNDQTISGAKTFSSTITGNISGNAASITGSITETQVTNLTTDLGNKAASGVNNDITSLTGLNTQAAVTLNPYGTSTGNAGEIRFLELNANGTNYIGLKAPDAIAADTIWTLPAADGTANQVMKTDGSGNLGWASAGTLSTLNEVSGGTGGTIADGSVTDADISASAGIQASKISGLGSLATKSSVASADITVPLILSGSDSNGVIRATNGSNIGYLGGSFGVYGETTGSNSVAVSGKNVVNPATGYGYQGMLGTNNATICDSESYLCNCRYVEVGDPPHEEEVCDSCTGTVCHSVPSAGVYGSSMHTSGYAGYFEGNATVTGQLSLAGGRWNVATTEGDFKIGDATNRLKIGVATGGGNAGISRIHAAGTTPKLVIGADAADVLTVTSANVGIGTLNPTEKLDVAGNVHVTGNLQAGNVETGDVLATGNIQTSGDVLVTGNYTYAAPKTFYYQLPAAAFNKSDDFSASWNQNGYMAYMSNGMNLYAYAPVNLPEDATATGLACDFYDNDSAEYLDFSASLKLRTIGDNTCSTIGSVNATTSGPGYSAAVSTVSSAFSHVVDNANNQYYISLEWRISTTSGGLRFYGCRITYTMTTLNP